MPTLIQRARVCEGSSSYNIFFKGRSPSGGYLVRHPRLHAPFILLNHSREATKLSDYAFSVTTPCDGENLDDNATRREYGYRVMMLGRKVGLNADNLNMRK